MAKANAFRFSTKYQDDETDLLYYGYRYYNASTGRWLSRDPLEEDGGMNLYCFVSNLPLSAIDACGLKKHVPYLFVHYRETEIGLGPALSEIRNLPKLIRKLLKAIEHIDGIQDLIGEETRVDERDIWVCDNAVHVATVYEFPVAIDGVDIGGGKGMLDLIHVIILYHWNEKWEWK